MYQLYPFFQEKKELTAQLVELDQKWVQCQGACETEKQRCVQLEGQRHTATAKCEKVNSTVCVQLHAIEKLYLI